VAATMPVTETTNRRVLDDTAFQRSRQVGRGGRRFPFASRIPLSGCDDVICLSRRESQMTPNVKAHRRAAFGRVRWSTRLGAAC
jgi:hypothetical protein